MTLFQMGLVVFGIPFGIFFSYHFMRGMIEGIREDFCKKVPEVSEKVVVPEAPSTEFRIVYPEDLC